MPWAPDYVTTPELKAYLRISDAVDDVQVALAVTGASRAVDRATNRQFGLVADPEARKYTAYWDAGLRRYAVDVDDLMTVVGLTIATEDGAITDYDLKPANAAVESFPWTRFVVKPEAPFKPPLTEDAVTVTAQYGWTTVPVAVKQATLLQAARFFKRRDAPFGVAGSPEAGSEMRLLAKVDPDVAVVLGPYQRWWGAA